MIDTEEINGVTVPEGVLLLEPREMYDKALVGVFIGPDAARAVYSRPHIIDLLTQENIEDGDEDPRTSAIEHFDFNVAGSMGVGFPVFVDDDEDDVPDHG